MKCLVGLFLFVSLLPAVAFTQTKKSPVAVQSGTVKNPNSQSGITKICRELAIPDGYIIVGYEPSAACRNGAYVLKREDQSPGSGTPQASRPRRIRDRYLDAVVANSALEEDASSSVIPKLQSTSRATPLDTPLNSSTSAGTEEVSEGDVVRIDTNLVTVPVSVLDRQGRFISDLGREQFRVFENGVEQQLVHFEPTDKPFTVALMLDTSASTFFHLWEIKEAAIAFARQLRPQDRVLVVTFDRLVMLLTEATGDRKVITEVIERDAVTGFSTRLYDAIDLVMKRRLNKIPGRKAIVLFTDGVDTASYQATYKSTLREVHERDVLIYPVQYDTTDFVDATSGVAVPNNGNDFRMSGRRATPHSGVIGDYKLADQFLRELADKTGARLYQANDRAQLAYAFSMIAGDLRSQYSLGYYPQDSSASEERRQIKVRVDQTDVAVRARESYVRVPPPSR